MTSDPKQTARTQPIMGTVFNNDGSWYVRLVGEGGNLTRLHAAANMLGRLTHGQMVGVTGDIERAPDGRIIGCNALSIQPLEPVQPAPSKTPTKPSSALTEAILAELAKDEPDWKYIEGASRGAVDSDPDAVRFSVDAAHIQRLGEQLVSKQETALSELIKNAFDADATEVTLDFARHTKIGGTLRIDDNGTGMTEAVIRAAWMRISTNTKEDEPRSPVFGRRRAGRKGIGRFSVQRLGKELIFITKPAGETVGFRVTFNWDDAFRAGVSLADVFSRIERFDKAADDQGTTLEILNLRDAWPNSTIDRVWKAVVLLQAPFPIARSATQSGNSPSNDLRTNDDPGFQVIINDVTRDQKAELFSIEKSFLGNALAEITASIDENGKARVHLVAKTLDIDEGQDNPHPFLLTGPVDLESRYFIFESSLLSGMTQAQAAQMGREFGGIRIYRNGFRVQPYGESSDDWLGLAFDTGRRNLIIPANNSNFFGHVELSAEDNPLFEETSSREGLIENEAFLELRTFTRWALEWAALRIAGARQRKKRASERGFTSLRVKPSTLLQQMLDARTNAGNDGSPPSANDDKDLTQLAQVVSDYEQQVEAKLAASIEYEEMLRVLASLGLSISVFGHEIKGAETALVANLILLADLIAEVPDVSLRADLQGQHGELDSSAGRLFDIGGYIGGLMSRTESRELRDLSVKGAIDRFATQFSGYMAKQNVSFDIDVDPPEMRTTPMHAAELDSVLLNFITNSIKSMKRARVADRQVRIEARREGRHVAIAFEDNGIGIPQDIQERIFDPFFTTTMAAEDDGVAGPGTGLGLKIVSDIAESYGGEVGVGQPTEGYSCRIEFKVLAITPKGSG